MQISIQWLKDRLQWLRHQLKADYLKNTSLLFSGSFISYILLFLGSIPILRMYGPELYGQYATLLSISGILIIPSTGQLHHGIFLEDDLPEIRNLLSLVFIFFITTIILGVVGLFIYSRLINVVPFQYFLIIPLFQFLGTLQILVNTLSIKAKLFKQISMLKIINAFIYVLVVLLMGLKKPNLIGLVVGYSLGIIISSLFLWKSSSVLNPLGEMKINWTFTIKDEYKRFIKYTLPGELLNSTMSQVPLLWINHFFGLANAGYYKFSTKILSIPVDLIANSLGTLYKSKANEELKKRGHAKDSFRDTFILLFFSGLVLFVLVYFVIDGLLPFIWGQKWSNAGLIIKSLLVIYFFKYSIGPLTYIAQLTSKQREILIINSIVACSIIMGFLISYFFKFALIPTIYTYAVFFCTSSLISFYYARKFSQ